MPGQAMFCTYPIVANLLPRVARLATGSGRLQKVLWEFFLVKSYYVGHNFVISDFAFFVFERT